MLQVIVNESLKLLDCMELLAVVLQVIVLLVVGLFKLDELLPLLGDFVIVTVAHVQLFIFDTLILLRQY